MSVYTAFFPGLGSEMQHWRGKAGAATFLDGEAGVLQQGRGTAAPLGWPRARGDVACGVGTAGGWPTPSGHRRNFTRASMFGSLWFGEEKIHFPMRKRSVPLSSGGTNSLLGVLGLPATSSTPE